MMMLNSGWGQRLWLSGAVVCVVSLVSTVAQAGIEGGDVMVAAGIEGGDRTLMVVNGIEGGDGSLTASLKVTANGIEGGDPTVAQRLQVTANGIEGGDPTVAPRLKVTANGIEGGDPTVAPRLKVTTNGIEGGDPTVAQRLTVTANGIEGGDPTVAAGIEGGDPNLDVLGVVEGGTSSSATVLGQTVRLTAGTRVTAQNGASFAKGSLVAVYGKINADGTISASQINVLARQYVAGSTALYVRGVVKSLNAGIATVKVGNLSIDYSSSLYSGSSSVTAGSVVEFSGLQSSTATLYASKVGMKPSGIEGGDRQ